MATQKKQKADLISIYRLEFYKKQKNWKLSADARQQKEPQKYPHAAQKKNNKILNETYSIESNVEDPNVLNDAFLKDDSVASEKDVPTSSVTHTSLHTQSLNPIHACQECQEAGNGPQSPWADYVDHPWPGSFVADRCSGDGNDFDGFDGWADGLVWTNPDMPQPGWDGDAAVRAESSEELVRAAERELRHRCSPWPDERAWSSDLRRGGSADGAARFMRGAHAAPHSSEVELTQDAAECAAGCALAAALRHHCGSLRRLLREAASRRLYRSTLSLDTCGAESPGRARRELRSAAELGYDTYPTRDLPCGPPHIQHYKEAFNPIQSPHNLYDNPQLNRNMTYHDRLELIDLYQRSDRFVPIKTNEFIDRDQLSPIERCEDCAVSLSSNQCGDSVTFCPTNLYRDGFLAGSHRNKPSRAVGRGRGRLLDVKTFNY